MVFIEGLPPSEGKSAIFFVVDRFTKYTHFFPLSHPFSRNTVARVFLGNILKMHGIPDSIISDRGTIFLSTFWSTIFKKLGSKFAPFYCLPSPNGLPDRVGQPKLRELFMVHDIVETNAVSHMDTPSIMVV